jgi:hypothetical protein
MTFSPDTQAPQAETKSTSRFTRGRALLPFLLLAAALPVGLTQAWMAHERRCIAYELSTLDDEAALVRDEISQAHIEVEALRSPTRTDTVAEELGLVRAESPPVVVAGALDPIVIAPPSTDPAPEWTNARVVTASFWPFGGGSGRLDR